MRVTTAIHPGGLRRDRVRAGAESGFCGRARPGRCGASAADDRRRRSAEVAAAQVRVISALRATGDLHPADRLARCMQARGARRRGDGWPWTCGSAGCAWCGRALARRWWLGFVQWAMEEEDDAAVSHAVLPARLCPGDLRAAVARLRRACRDVRDRTARRNRRWCDVALAGMVTGDGTALLLIRHAGVERMEIAGVLRRRWPGSVVGDVGAKSPSWTFTTGESAELARARRGVEPLRIVVLPRRGANTGGRRRADAHELAEQFAPMPIAF